MEAEEGVDEYTASLTWTGVGGLNGSSFSRFRVAPTLLEAQADSGTSGIGEVEDYPINLATLPVTVAYFSSTKSGNTIDVTWWSGTESANAGYVIFGEKPNGKQIALTDIIVGAGDSFLPLEYRQSVSGNYTTLWLADVDLVGVETLHGPYEVGKEIGTVPAPVALDWKPAQAQVVAGNQTAEPRRITAQNQATATAVGGQRQRPATGQGEPRGRHRRLHGTQRGDRRHLPGHLRRLDGSRHELDRCQDEHPGRHGRIG